MTKLASSRRMLAACWAETWSRLELRAPSGTFEDLLARYLEPWRHYHGVRHLCECLEAVKALERHAEHRWEVCVALFFHDAINVPGAADNERRSAALAARALRHAGAGTPCVRRIRECVLATCHARSPASADACVVVDADLWILGTPWPRFAACERDVRLEYAALDDRTYRTGRARVLRRFLEREWIYCTEQFRTERERQARENLQRSVAALQALQ